MAKKKILFACIGNCCRSQMAEGFGKKIAGDKFEIYSAGSHPAGYVHPDAIAGMKEVGIDISSQYSKGFNEIPKEFDYIVTMGCGEECPLVAAKQRLDWQIPDPIGRGIDFFREVRDELKGRVEEFFASHEK
ncbi:MAG: arsenate reductase ArsC [Candidatus Margulisiibacteriota bacterium]